MKHAFFQLTRKFWSRLPVNVRRSPPILAAGTRLRRLLSDQDALSPEPVAPAAIPAPLPIHDAAPGQPRVIDNLAELDGMLRMLDHAAISR